jgi:RND family efflux transporter MFP subunit
MRVSAAPVQREIAPASVEIPGTVRPAERATIAAKISGSIDALPLTLGQSVKRGELLVRLTAPELTARLAQTRAQLEQAEREEKRNRELAATGADTADAARAAAERLRATRAAVAEAEAMLAYTEIRAPYDGRVAQKLAYSGDFAAAGSPLLVLERSAALQVEAAVPASLASGLTLGAELTVQISGVATPITGRVTEIAAAADATTHTLLVKIDLASPDPAWSGRAVRVQLHGESTESLFGPASAVSRFGQMERVFVVAGGKALLRLVKTGATHGDRVEFLAGVSAGESVVIAPPGTLRDGQPIVTAP